MDTQMVEIPRDLEDNTSPLMFPTYMNPVILPKILINHPSSTAKANSVILHVPVNNPYVNDPIQKN